MNILIIEDEYSLADAVAETLKKESFNVCIKTNGENGESEALTNNYDLIILDVMLPKKNGFEILKNLRVEKIKTPIIMLTAKSDIEDKLNLNLKNAILKCNDNEIQISGKEYELLEQLLLNKNQILSRENLLERIWGFESEA